MRIDNVKVYGIIYEAVNKLNNKKYIGQTTTSLKIRKRGHESESTYSNDLFHKTIREEGKDNFEWIIIDKANSQEELDLKEMFWIKFFKTYIKRYGYNMTLGGQLNKEMLNYNHIEECNVPNYGIKNYKNILVYNAKGEYVKTTTNETKLAEELGLSVSLVNNVLKNRKNSVGNYFLFFEDEFTEEKLQDKLNKKRWNRDFVIFDAKTKDCIGVWNNILQCEKEQSLASRRGIQLQLNTIQKQRPRKFICKFVDNLDEELQKSLNTYLELNNRQAI